jgi:hypothetical protein
MVAALPSSLVTDFQSALALDPSAGVWFFNSCESQTSQSLQDLAKRKVQILHDMTLEG